MLGGLVGLCCVELYYTPPSAWLTLGVLLATGLTLALLNLYPFEQYIHMEICRAEYDEMLCRPGCRCEQQYRLQRLLAFDPSNECRGVFSDWFRFPSFCICKCYDSARQLREVRRTVAM